MATAVLSTASRVTPRQVEVIRGIARGLSNEEIGVELGISPRTVKAHCDQLRWKFLATRRRLLPTAYYEATGDNPFPNGAAS